MKKYKLSKYIIPINGNNDSTILFNAITGGVIKVERNVFDFLVENLISNEFENFGVLKKAA